MSTYTKLPALLEKIGTLESERPLCRRRWCYAPSFSWLPYCEAHQEPVPFRFLSSSDFGRSRFALMADIRLSMSFAPHARGLSPFIQISSAC